jgi:hypothetical protein
LLKQRGRSISLGVQLCMLFKLALLLAVATSVKRIFSRMAFVKNRFKK